MKLASYVRRTLLIVIIGLLGTGVLCLLSTQLPYDWVKYQLDAQSVDGDAKRFTQATYERVVNRLYWLSAISFVLGILAGVFRKAVGHTAVRWTEKTLADGKLLWQDCIQGIQKINQPKAPLHFAILSIILVLAIGIRLYFLFQPVRHDEAFTFTNYASKPLMLVLSNYSFPNNHLFHTFCVHISYLLFGNQLWAIRLPALFAGILLLPLAYVLVHTFYNRHAALITTALLAVSSAMIEYGTNARGYALIGLIFVLTLLLANYLRTKHNQAGWLLLSVVSAIGFHTVPVMLYPFATIWFWILLSAWKKDFSLSLKKTLLNLIAFGTLTVALTCILYLPVIVASGLDAIINNRFVQPMTLPLFLTRLPARLSDVWLQWSRDYHVLLIGLLASGIGMGTIFHRSVAHHRICLILPALLSLIILLPLQGVLPPERVWLYLLPLFLMIASAGLIGIIQKMIPAHSLSKGVPILGLALSLWCSVGAYQTMTNYYPYGPGTLKDAESITEFLKSQFRQQDRLLTIATAAPLEYYFRKHEVPIHYLREEIANSNRLIVLVLENKYTLDQVLRTAQISEHEFSSPTLLRAYPSARLYEMKRQITAQQMHDQQTGQENDNRH